MMTFEKFKCNNQGFGHYQFPELHEKEMQKCYAIAQEVERTYQECYGHINGPRIGDIVEFSDGYSVYKHGKIVEDCYGGSAYGLLSVCESGSSFTNGRRFSTSGGAFRSIHKSKMQLVGEEDYNLVWTWGCYGSGAHQGIYFTLKVRRWLVPYDKTSLERSKLIIRGRGKKGHDGSEMAAVVIRNFGSFFDDEHFDSIKAFRAWADYVGYKTHQRGGSVFEKASHQRIDNQCYTNPAWQPPVGAKPIKHIFNGSVKDAWVVTSDDCIMYYWPNIFVPYGSSESEREIKDFRRYNGNPMGI